MMCAMRTSSLLGVVAFIAGLLGGCSKSAPPPGQVVSVDQVCNGADGSRVRLTGYLRYRRGLLSFCSSYGGHPTCDLELYRDPVAPPSGDLMHPQTGPDPVSAKLSVPVGSRTGEMPELPDKFTAADVRLHLPNDGNAGDGSRITIDGTLSVIPSDPKAPTAPKSCFVTVEWATAS